MRTSVTDIARKPGRFLKGVRRVLHRSADFRSAKEQLLLCDALTHEEKAVLNKVSLLVHHYDGTYLPAPASHYLSVGLSAIQCIDKALNQTSVNRAIRRVLDFGCGYGRVLRFLRVRFPHADITASDIDPVALDFCQREFSLESVMSDEDFQKLSLPRKYDLIWCGSLITHIDERGTTDLLKFFHDHLLPGGLCVVTSVGQSSMQWIQTKRTQLPQQEVFAQFHRSGYGYSDYKGRRGYGASIVSYDRMLTIARGVGQWDLALHLERGWIDYQDTYAFTKAE